MTGAARQIPATNSSRRPANTGTRRTTKHQYLDPGVIFEFQRELSNGEWKALGLSRSLTDEFEVDETVRALVTLEGAASQRLLPVEITRR